MLPIEQGEVWSLAKLFQNQVSHCLLLHLLFYVNCVSRHNYLPVRTQVKPWVSQKSEDEAVVVVVVVVFVILIGIPHRRDGLLS